jgi:hypothetical protein
MIAIRSSPASAPVRRLRQRDAHHPHGGWWEAAELGSRERPRTPRQRPGAEALFPLPAAAEPAPLPGRGGEPGVDGDAERTSVTALPARSLDRARRLGAERELLALIVVGGSLAAFALLPTRPLSGGDLWLAAAALGSGLALLLVGRRFR